MTSDQKEVVYVILIALALLALLFLMWFGLRDVTPRNNPSGFQTAAERTPAACISGCIASAKGE